MKKYIYTFLLLAIFPNIIIGQRINMTINSAWRFQLGEINSTFNALNSEEWEIINLPHTWNTRDAFDETPGYYRGIGWYQKELFIPLEWKDKSVYLKFEGANQTAEFLLNGKTLGSHIGGYTAFGFDLSDDLDYGQVNTFTLKIDNSHDENIPPLRADFTFYGGIYRNVKVIVTEPVHFDLNNYASDGVFIETPEVGDQEALVTVRGSIVSNISERKNVIVETAIIDKNNQVIGEGTTKLTLSSDSKNDFLIEGLQIPSPQLWSPDSPYLYHCITEIREDTDDAVLYDKMDLPIGFRWFEFDSIGGFRLNGKPLKLIGSNRHQDFDKLGNALTDDYHVKDFKHIKELGFNFVRLAHYPQAPEVYRICDELGLLVWSEIPVVSSITNSDEFTQVCLNMQREHIRQTLNYPSVIFYGYMNEILLGFQFNRNLSEAEHQQVAQATIDLANKLENLTKMEAPHHYTVMANHRHQSYNEYGLTDIPDVVGWNLYFGWYYENIEDLTKFLADQHAKYPHQRMIVSEYGPGADVRIHSSTPDVQDFSEDYQFELHVSYLKQMMNLPYLAGFAAWNFADFGSSGRADAIPNINQKGLVNYDRTEKDVCGLYRAYFSKEPVIHIASHNFTRRSGIEHSDESGICMDNVKVFSNQDEIELWLNGEVLESKPIKDYEVNFTVPFKNGENLLTAVDENGHEDHLVIDYTVLPADMKANGIKDLAVNVGANVTFFDPGTQVLWIPDREYTPNAWGYSGGKPYTVQRRQLTTGISQDIKGTDRNPLFQTFVEGINSYRFDVPDGNYTLTLCFTEYITRSSQDELIFNLTNNDSSENEPEAREFEVLINGKNVIHKLNLEEEYGSLRAVTFDFQIRAENETGIQLDFRPASGQALLSGIRIKCLN